MGIFYYMFSIICIVKLCYKTVKGVFIMKKISKVFTFLLIVGFLFNPISASAATVESVYELGNYKEIHYSPYDLFIINPGYTHNLENNVNNGAWFIEGSTFSFEAHLIIPCNVRVSLYSVDTQQILFSDDLYLSNTTFGFTYPIFSSGNYRVILTPLNDTTFIMDYFATWR